MIWMFELATQVQFANALGPLWCFILFNPAWICLWDKWSFRPACLPQFPKLFFKFTYLFNFLLKNIAAVTLTWVWPSFTKSCTSISLHLSLSLSLSLSRSLSNTYSLSLSTWLYLTFSLFLLIFFSLSLSLSLSLFLGQFYATISLDSMCQDKEFFFLVARPLSPPPS